MFDVQPHPEHDRVRKIILDDARVSEFLDECCGDDVQALERVPFLRFITARRMTDTFGESLATTVREILHDRSHGGLTIGLGFDSPDDTACLKLATAVAHLIGVPNFDAMTGAYYARFAVQHVNDSDSYLREAYRDMTLHTDGTYVDEPTDWVLMMKSAERNATGGRSRLLHLDDWHDLQRLFEHPLAKHQFVYKSPPSKNVHQSVRHSTFYERDDRPCISFIDQFAQPETVDEAEFLFELSQSLEQSPAVKKIGLDVGELLLINNHFWLHGREAFATHHDLVRQLIRLRGHFVAA